MNDATRPAGTGGGGPAETTVEAYFTRPAPTRELPAAGVDAESALTLLRSEVMLDGDPSKNLATFVTTHMEPQAQQVIVENLHRNFIDHAEYPRTAEIARRCMRMIHGLFHGPGEPEAPGTACVGSSEAVMLGALAMKWRWKRRREAEGKPTERPNLVYGGDVHVVWDKFCRYFDVEPRKVDVPVGRTTVGPEELGPRIDENTIGVVAVVGTTFTGECDDVVGIDRHLAELRSRGLEVPMHVDAASGGFVFPFSHPEFAWDFRLESVKSINVSGHKFGLVYPGIGWLVFRDDEQLPEDLVFYEDYLGERDATFTLNFSASSSFVLAQYYMFLRLGWRGYASLVRAMTANRDALAARLEKVDGLRILTDPERPTLPLLIAEVADGEGFAAPDLVGDLTRRNGWLIPAYELPPENDGRQVIRMLVKTNQTRELVEALGDDFEAAVAYLRERAAAGGLRGPRPAVHSGHAY